MVRLPDAGRATDRARSAGPVLLPMIRLRLLGECLIEVGEEVIGPDAQLVFATLLHLALERGSRIPRRQLHALLWPEADEEHGRHCLRQVLYKLRQAGVRLQTTQTTVCLPPDQVEGDVVALERDELPALPSPRTDVWPRPAREPATGEFLPGYVPRFSAPFAEWVEERRAVVHGQLRRLLLDRLLAHRGRGAWREAERVARDLLRFDPLNEEATLAVAEATALSGGKSEALGIIDRYLREIGGDAGDIRLPATVLRRRIAERLPAAGYGAVAEAPFVEREGSMARIMATHHAALKRIARPLLIRGAEGLGKTRLLAEAEALLLIQGIKVLRIECAMSSRLNELSLFQRLVPAFMSHRGALGVAPGSMRLLERLASPIAFESRPERASGALEGMYQALVNAITDLLDAVTSENDMVVLIDNFEYLDSSSKEMLSHILSSPIGVRFALIVTCGDNTHQRLGSTLHGATIADLAPLSDAAATDVLRHYVRVGSIPDDATASLLAFARGNPLVLREIGMLAVRGETTLDLTWELTHLAKRRLDGIAPMTLTVIRLLAVIGHAETPEMIARALEISPDSLLASLEEAERAGLLRTEGTTVTLAHAVVRDAAAAGMPASVLAYLRNCAARTLTDRLRSHFGHELLLRCIEAVQSSDQRHEAKTLLREQALQLCSLGLLPAALEAYSRAEALCTVARDRFSVLLDRAHAARTFSDWHDLALTLDRAALLPSGVEQDAQDLALLRAELDWYLKGDAALVLPQVSSLAHSPSARDSVRDSACLLGTIITEQLCSRLGCDEFVQCAGRPPSVGRRAEQLAATMIFHSSFGDLDHAVAAASELVARQPDAVAGAADVRRMLWTCIPLYRAGHTTEALTRATVAFSLAESLSLCGPYINAADTIGSILFDVGKIDEAYMWYERGAARISRLQGGIVGEGITLLGAKCMLESGHADQARMLIGEPNEFALNDPFIRRRTEYLAVWAAIQLALGTKPDSSVVESLRRAFVLSYTCGGQDYAAASLAASMNADGSDRGTSLTRHYLAGRRDRLPLPRYFTRVAE